jgi:hypothetical protein
MPDALGLPCQLLGAMLASLPSHAGLGEECLRFLHGVRAPLAQLLAPPHALGSTVGLQAAASAVALLAAALGALDGGRRDGKLRECFPGHQEALLGPCARLLAPLAAFPSAQTPAGGAAWASLLPSSPEEAGAARVLLLPPPGAAAPWSAFDSVKAEAWWRLALGLSLALRRAAKLAPADPAPLLACAAAVAEPLLRDPGGAWGWLGDRSAHVAEALLAAAVERWWVAGPAERTGTKATLVGLLSRIEALHGAAPTVYGSASESELFLKKFCQALAREFDNHH